MNDITNYERDKYLYHYTSMDTAINYILKSSSLRFSPYKYVNDPLEFKKWKFELEYDKKLFSDFDFSDIKIALDSVGSGMIEHSKLLCFSRDHPSNRPLSENNPNDFYSRNWSRGFGYPRMWAQYGDAHRGICLVFDKDLLEREIENQFKTSHQILHSEVVYGIYTSKDDSYPYTVKLSEDFLLDFNKAISNHLEKNRLGLFFLKSSDWINEREYRWVINNNSTGYEYYNFEKALAAVVIGSEAIINADDLNTLRTTVFQIKWDYLNPNLTKIKSA